MTYLKKFKIFKKIQDRFFDIASKKIKKVRKKPQSKIGIAALMPLNKNREKISKIARGDSFLV